jgi:hypothetical protein
MPWIGYRESAVSEPAPAADTDNDGLPDWWEEKYFASSTAADPNADEDNDGLTNFEEYQRQSDPTTRLYVKITQPAANPTLLGAAADSITVGGISTDAAKISIAWNGVILTELVWTVDVWTSSVPLSPGENLIVVTAKDAGGTATTTDSVTIIRDALSPSIWIEMPTAASTYLTELVSISLGGMADDNTGVSAVAWERTDGSSTVTGTASGTRSWTTTEIPLVSGVTNTITVTATDLFGNTSSASLTVTHQPKVLNVKQDLSSEGAQPAGNPLDLDGDNYLNEDETACGSDPNTAGSVPANFLGVSYPVDPNDPNFDPKKVKRDAGGKIIGTYHWPDCLNPDDDQDGMPDLWEIQYGLNPKDAADAGLDLDGDGTTNLEEYQNGTDPTQAPSSAFQVNVLNYPTGGNVYDTWLPEFGKVLRIQVTWMVGTPPASLIFTLTSTSRYPGRAMNDPDPAKTTASYPAGYDFNGFDFGLSQTSGTTSYAQGPIEVPVTNGVSEIYLQCWDFGGRTRLTVSHPTDPSIEQVLWIPKGSGSNGIGSAWEHDSGLQRLDPNADVDAIVFDNPSQYTAPLGDDFSNFEEYRGIVYTPAVGGVLQHKRLNPYRKDLFIRSTGFDSEYPFQMGEALKNAGVDVHDTTSWGHDATEGNTFFSYYTTGHITKVSNYEVTGSGTQWADTWPAYEFEFRLEDVPGRPWTPISGWGGVSTMYLTDRHELKEGDSLPYTIRMPLPHINVLIARLDRVKLGVFSSEDGHIKFLAASPPSVQNPLGTRHWAWATKGLSVRGQKGDEYGVATGLKIPLDGYFGDRPYEKGTIWSWDANSGTWVWRLPVMDSGSQDLKLRPLGECEDPADSGVHVDGYMDESLGVLLGNTPNGQWDGDKRLMNSADWEKKGHLNPFDIDHDGAVELPMANNPDADNYSKQHDDKQVAYTKARVLQHTMTHEIIHALAGPWHSKDPKCVMYEYSTNWKRDDYLCDQYRSQLKIHNKSR